jgi:peptidoglycan/LPS O-acetylase OafA/YrhL
MKEREVWLDWVRGGSALLVMLGHLRAFLFIDYGQLEAPGIFSKIFYFVTGLGHQAVMVFFVLSGYFVGGSVLNALQSNRFSWSNYGIARLSRLWVVLVPALIMTLILDQLGAHLNPDAYAGGFADQFMSGPRAGSPTDNGILTGIGNLAFLQTVSVPVFGSNGPLWSLANEFWYYVMFPLLAVSVWSLRKKSGPAFKRDKASVVFGLILLGVLLIWLPRSIVILGLVWMFGVVVWALAKQEFIRVMSKTWMWRVGFAALFLGALAASKTSHWFGSDIVLGLVFAGWMLGILGAPARTGLLSRLSIFLSDISYTLYVVHFPILFFVAAVGFHGNQFAPNVYGISLFVGLTILVSVFAVGMWWVFERNTAKVRAWVLQRIGTLFSLKTS